MKLNTRTRASFAAIKRTWARLQTRRWLLWSCFASVAAIFVVNLAGLILLATHRDLIKGHPPSYIPDPPIFEGDCDYADTLGTVLHAVINALSTIMLAASNVCMQMLLSPTRTEINKAHRGRSWLHIGYSSLGNFRYVGMGRRLVWLLLALSSIPLHLLYNSAVYGTKPSVDAKVYVLAEGFNESSVLDWEASLDAWHWRQKQQLMGLELSNAVSRDMKLQPICPEHDVLFGYNWYICGDTEIVTETRVNASTGETIDQQTTSNITCPNLMKPWREGAFSKTAGPFDCLNAYSNHFGNRSDVIIFADYDYLSQQDTMATNSSNPLLFAKQLTLGLQFGFWNHYDWRCGTTNSFDCRRPSLWEADPTIMQNWNIQGWRVHRCHYMEFPSIDHKCAVRGSIEIMIAVCIMNFLKGMGILYAMWAFGRIDKEDTPLTVLGDALSSFLKDPDDNTIPLNLLDERSLKTDKNKDLWNTYQPRVWAPRPKRWFQAASWRRWLSSFLLFVALVAAGTGLIINNIFTYAARAGTYSAYAKISFNDEDPTGFAQLGLNVNAGGMTRRNAFFIMVFFANCWQLLLSISAIILNGLLTYLRVEAEWQNYAQKRAYLRVSWPTGAQRCSFFLSLPWKYAVPFHTAFYAAHFVLSQGIFVTVVESYYGDGEWSSGMPFLVTSGLPLFASIAFAVLIALLFLGLSLQKHPGLMPLGGTCSAVISASCHGPKRDAGAETRAVKWGIVLRDELSDSDVAPFVHSAGTTGPYPPSQQLASPASQTSIQVGVTSAPTATSLAGTSASGSTASFHSIQTTSTHSNGTSRSPNPVRSITGSNTQVGAAPIRSTVVSECESTASVSAGHAQEEPRFGGKCCFSSWDVKKPEQDHLYI